MLHSEIFKISTLKLRSITQNKGYKENYAIRFIRLLSIYFTYFFIYFGFSPNTISALSLILGSTGCLLLATSFSNIYVIAVFLILIAFIFDHSDGEVSRYFKKSTKAGAWLDIQSFEIIYPLIFICITYSLLSQRWSPIIFITGISAALSKTMFRMAELRYITMNQHMPSKKSKSLNITKEPSFFSIKGLLVHISKVYTIILLLMISVVFDIRELFVIFYGILLTPMWIGLLFLQYNRLKNTE